jgi:hypothetical protein
MPGGRRVAGRGAERVRAAARWGEGARWLITGVLGSPDVTTVTPSDRADAISSSKRPAAIPTQRSDRALRLLVLGTGDDAVAFRERATQAGAELAQRFSVRVTHVVVEDGVGEQDARVVRARTAGVPVLGLVDGDELLAGDGDGDGDEAEMGAEDVGHVAGGGEAAVVAAAGDDVEAGAQWDGAAESGVEEPAVEDDPHRRVVSLIRPRAELAPEPTDVRPSDVFTDSALEAVLHFPALHDGEDEAEPGDQAPADTERSVSMDVVAESCGCGEEAAGTEAEGAGDLEVAEAAGNAIGSGRGRTSRAAASVAWALLPFVSIGLLTPIGMAYAAYRLRSRVLSIATACYTIAVGAAFAVSAASPVRTGTHAAAGELLLACLGASWLGGTVHSFLIRRRVFG